MSRLFFTLDGGTTNTRISLVRDGEILRTLRISLGARAGIEGTEPLRSALKDAIADLLLQYGYTEEDVTCIIASGMITSELGLYPLPHLIAPVGIRELKSGMKRVSLNEITSIPFCFIPGVKIMDDDLSRTDMMRGEETELMGILHDGGESCVYILPGSHSKIIRTDADGRITDFSTLLTGEMAQALAQNTILKDAVDLSTDEIDSKALLAGFDLCRKQGLNKALFKTRVLKNLFGATPRETYSFFLGAVLCPEIDEILRYDAKVLIIGGREQLKEALACLLSHTTEKQVIPLTREEVDRSVTLGMLRIFDWKN